MGGYFQNIKNGFQSVFEGMSVTLASMFVRPVTVQYPEVDITNNETISKSYKSSLMGMPENYRGVLDLDLSLCTRIWWRHSDRTVFPVLIGYCGYV